jgi:hypothetical protein
VFHGAATPIRGQVATFAMRTLPSIWSLKVKKVQKELHKESLLC